MTVLLTSLGEIVIKLYSQRRVGNKSCIIFVKVIFAPLPPSHLSVLAPFITIRKFHHYGPHMELVDSIDDSTEVAIQKMIEGCEKMIRVSNNNNNNDSQQEEVRINPAMKRHYELEI